MTCLYLLRVFPVLSETFILSQITGLLDRGVDVRIVAMARPPEQTSVVHEQVQAYDLQERTTYLHDPATGPLARLRPAEVLQNPALAARVLRPWRYGNKAINGSLLHLAARWREQGLTPSPDVVVAHFGPVGELAVCLRDAGVFDGPRRHADSRQRHLHADPPRSADLPPAPPLGRPHAADQSAVAGGAAQRRLPRRAGRRSSRRRRRVGRSADATRARRGRPDPDSVRRSLR